MLCHPCLLREPPCQAKGAKSETVASPLPGGPKEGGNATSALHARGSPTPSAGNEIGHDYLNPPFSGGQKEGGNATSRVHSRRFTMPSAGSKIRSGYPTPAFSGGQKWVEMLCHPCILRGPQRQARAAKSEMAASPLPCREDQKRKEMLRHPCILGAPQRQARGAKAEVVVSFVTSWHPQRGRKCYITPACSGVPNVKRGEQKHKWLFHSLLFGGPKDVGHATSPLHPRGSPTPSAGSIIRSGDLIPAFSGGQKRAEMICHACILRGPQRQARGTKSDMVASALACLEAKKKVETVRLRCILGRPQRQARGAKSEMVASALPCPCREAEKRAEMLRHLGGPQRQGQGAKSEVAISSLPSRGAKSGRKCYVTHAFSGVPNAKRGEQNQKWLPHLVGRPKRWRK